MEAAIGSPIAATRSPELEFLKQGAPTATTTVVNADKNDSIEIVETKNAE